MHKKGPPEGGPFCAAYGATLTRLVWGGLPWRMKLQKRGSAAGSRPMSSYSVPSAT